MKEYSHRFSPFSFVSRAGSNVSGQYSVKEPNGSVRVVSYRADKDGFHAVVHTSGKNEHTAGISGPSQGQPRVHDHQDGAQQEQQDYVSFYSAEDGYWSSFTRRSIAHRSATRL